MVWQAVVSFFKAVGAFLANPYTQAALTAYTAYTGVKGYRQAKDMQAKAAEILANKNSAGGKLPIIYGTRRVGAQVVYMDTADNYSMHLFVVYAISVGEVDDINLKTLEIDGNLLSDPNQFRDGGYIGSDKISSGAGSLCTGNQVIGTPTAGAIAGFFGTDPAGRGYRYVFNAHHGAATQTADPMLTASIGSKWTSAHKLNGVAYIAASFYYDEHGTFRGVPQITVQVSGKKVYDPRLDSTAGGSGSQRLGTPSTYAFSDNPALTFLDYIVDNQYGKGLTASQLNISTFSSAADVADTAVDQPYYNGTAKSFTWSGNSGDNFISVPPTGSGGLEWWQNKVGEILTITDSSSNVVLNNVYITAVERSQTYNQPRRLLIYFDGTLGATYSSQNGTALAKVKRFHCNGYVDGNNTVMENSKELLANMRGIFLYIDGKYELSIEDTGSSTFSITDNHIIADTGISVDYGNKDKKANKVIVEFFNANKKYELDTATVLHDANPEYYSDDGDEILEIKAEFPFVSDPYIAYNMGKAILTRSRNQTSMQFLGTPEMYKLNVGDIVDLTYAGLGFSGKVCRVEALELQSNGLVAVSLIEYFDVYTWEVPPQEELEELSNTPSAYAVTPPTGITFTDTNASGIDRPFISWSQITNFPSSQFRLDLENSSGTNIFSKLVDTNSADLSFIPTGTNYVAKVTSINSLGVESEPSSLTFTVSDAPVALGDIQANAITANEINVANLAAISADLGSITAGSMNIGSGAFTVSSAGVMTATGATIAGALTATSLNVTGATVTGTLDASTITLDGDPLDDLFGVSGSGTAKTLSIGADTKNQLKVDGIQMTYKAYNNAQSTGDVAFEMDEYAAIFYNDGSGGDGRVEWTPTKIFPGNTTSNTNSPGIATPRVTINQSTVNDDYFLYAGGTSYINKLYIPNVLGVGASSFNATYDPKLQVTSGANDGTGGILIQNYLPTLTLEDISGGAAVSQIQQDQTNMLFKNNGSEAFRIDAGQRVMIGVSSNTNIANNADDLIVGNNTQSGETGITLGSTSASTVRFNDGADSGSIEYNHSTNAMRFGTNSAVAVTFDSSGNLTATGNVTAYSDERLKTNIETLDANKTLQMRGVSFIKDGKKGSGVIAQEIETIAPELVITANDEQGTKSVAYGNLVGYLIETVKHQQKQIDALNKRLDNDIS